MEWFNKYTLILFFLFVGPAASATNVGAGSPRGGSTSSPRAGAGAGARQRAGKGSTKTVAPR